MTRTITTAAELAALPVGSVVRGAKLWYGPAAVIYVRQEEFWYCGWGVEEEAQVVLPVVVLHDPSAPVVREVSCEDVADVLCGNTGCSCAVCADSARHLADDLLARFVITERGER